MANLDIVIEKMLKMQQYINQLKELKPVSYEEYIQDIRTKYAIERIIQLIIDLALDINNIILSYMGKPPASDYYNSFIDLVECDVLDPKFAADIAPSTGLRNRLVHEYENIDDKIVYISIAKVIDMYIVYMDMINRFLGSAGL